MAKLTGLASVISGWPSIDEKGSLCESSCILYIFTCRQSALYTKLWTLLSVERAHATIVKRPPQQASNAHNRRQTAGSDWFFEYYGRKMLQIETLSVTTNA
jgi:hypothetical protein